MVCDFGELPINEHFFKAEDDEFRLISGGRICCPFGIDLSAALLKLGEMEGWYDRILNEASSVARPEEILGYVGLIRSVSPDGIVILVDAETFKKAHLINI